MNGLVYHVASGQAFFTGAGLLVLAALLSIARHKRMRRATVLMFIIGVIAVVVSSTAIAYWYYAVACGLTLMWLVSLMLDRWRGWLACLTAAVWTGAVVLEVPYHLAPAVAPVSKRSFTVIGDSVTAGMGGEDDAETWPRILAREHNVAVQDVSHVGETAASALERLKETTIESELVLVEIGGNDLLGSTSSSQFARDLEALLNHVCRNDRQVVMFELPLPPSCHEYGRIQRTLARRFGVRLIPKRIFLAVLAAEESTLDSIHLSADGHRRMAACVWNVVRPAFERALPASLMGRDP